MKHQRRHPDGAVSSQDVVSGLPINLPSQIGEPHPNLTYQTSDWEIDHREPRVHRPVANGFGEVDVG